MSWIRFAVVCVASLALGLTASFLLPPSDAAWQSVAGFACLWLAGYVAGNA